MLSLQTSDLVGGRKPSKLHDAAQQFEALMLGEMLKSVRDSGSDGWLGAGDDAGSDSMTGMAEFQLANALAKGGGIGLSKMIEQTMTPHATAQHVTAVSEREPGVSTK